MPDAEDAKITQRTQKNSKENPSIFEFIFGFLLRPLRNFRVLCVRPSPLSLPLFSVNLNQLGAL
jgi:hypothetical protein